MHTLVLLSILAAEFIDECPIHGLNRTAPTNIIVQFLPREYIPIVHFGPIKPLLNDLRPIIEQRSPSEILAQIQHIDQFLPFGRYFFRYFPSCLWTFLAFDSELRLRLQWEVEEEEGGSVHYIIEPSQNYQQKPLMLATPPQFAVLTPQYQLTRGSTPYSVGPSPKQSTVRQILKTDSGTDYYFQKKYSRRLFSTKNRLTKRVTEEQLRDESEEEHKSPYRLSPKLNTEAQTKTFGIKSNRRLETEPIGMCKSLRSSGWRRYSNASTKKSIGTTTELHKTLNGSSMHQKLHSLQLDSQNSRSPLLFKPTVVTIKQRKPQLFRKTGCLYQRSKYSAILNYPSTPPNRQQYPMQIISITELNRSIDQKMDRLLRSFKQTLN